MSVTESGIKISKPEIRKETAVDSTGVDTEYSDKLSSAVGADGLIPVRVENDVIIQRISRDLYANATSGIRELYANEARAARTARREYGADPLIRVTHDSKSHSLCIEGVDSLGIDQDRFLEVLRYLGRSDNHNAGESGQFGMGFASYTTLSDVVILETYSRLTGEKYAVMGKGGMGFQPIQKPEMDSYGTRMTLTLRKDVNFIDVLNMVRDCALLSTVKTVIVHTEMGRVTSEEECHSGILADKISNGGHNPTIEIGDDEINVAIVTRDFYRTDVYAYLAGIPIRGTYSGKFDRGVCDVAFNVLDERKYRPTPDRERFPKDVAERIEHKIDELIISYIKNMKYDSFEEFLNDKTSCIANHSDNQYLSEDFQKDFLNLSSCGGQQKRLSDRSDILKYRNATVRDHYKPGKLLVTKVMEESLSNEVIKSDNEITIFRPHDLDLVDKFREHGIETLQEYAKRNGIKKNIIDRKIRCWDGYGHTTYNLSELPENVIYAKTMFDEINIIIGAVSGYRNSTLLVTKNIAAKDVAISEEEICKKAINYLLDTTDGIMTIGQIKESGKEPKFIEKGVKISSLEVKDDVIGVDWKDISEEGLFFIKLGLKRDMWGDTIVVKDLKNVDKYLERTKIKPYADVTEEVIALFDLLDAEVSPVTYRILDVMLKEYGFNDNKTRDTIEQIDDILSKYDFVPKKSW